MEFEVYYTVITSNEAHGVRPPRSSMNIRAQKKQLQFKAPKFCLAGHVHINIDDVRSGIVSKDLTMGKKMNFCNFINLSLDCFVLKTVTFNFFFFFQTLTMR